MAAAYAAVVSLMNTVENVRNHACLSSSLDKNQIESLSRELGFLEDFLQRHSHGGSDEAQDLEQQIASAAYAAEDLIDSHMGGQILKESIDYPCSISLDLHKVIGDMVSIKEKVILAQDMNRVNNRPIPKYSKLADNSSRASPIGKISVVGLENELIQVMERLTSGQSSRHVIPIVGMGGIGKTTLARFVYQNPYIEHYFDIRYWVTISQEYFVRDLLLQIPICQEHEKKSNGRLGEGQLGEILYKSLSGLRYLIVMDDIWSIEAWDDMQHFFPENSNMSRILVTTRLTNVAMHLGGSCSFKINFLDEDKSWKLFCDNTFREETCPSELEYIGRKIVQKCKGLPLSIIVIAGLLANSCKTREFWESVADDTNSILNAEDEDHCLSILSLSYKHLSTHLKPCFLYMGVFPEDYEIHASKLFKLWIAEGFLQRNNAKSLEDVAEDYLQDLVYRNLLLVHKWRYNRKVKTFYIHDLLRNLCLKEAWKEGFFGLLKNSDSRQMINGMRRIVSHGILYWPLPPFIYSFMNFGEQPIPGEEARTFFKNGPKVQLLNNVEGLSYEDMFQQVNVRFMSYDYYSIDLQRLPSSTHQLWNLQTIIFNNFYGIVVPIEIWEMQQLRHVESPIIYLPHPPDSCTEEGDTIVLYNLQTIMKIINFKWSQGILKRISRIKKMKLSFDQRQLKWIHQVNTISMEDYCLHNLCGLEMLESLHIHICIGEQETRDLLRHLKLPCSLKKLVLEQFVLFWDDLTMFGSLPNLKVLKFRGSRSNVIGHEWNPIDGEFPTLKSLIVQNCEDLIFWNADNFHFPVLEYLHFGNVMSLEMIPLGIGEIPTLRAISLHFCKSLAAISVMKILIEQVSFGIDDVIEVRVTLKSDKEEEFFNKFMELEGLMKNNNFHIENR